MAGAKKDFMLKGQRWRRGGEISVGGRNLSDAGCGVNRRKIADMCTAKDAGICDATKPDYLKKGEGRRGRGKKESWLLLPFHPI